MSDTEQHEAKQGSDAGLSGVTVRAGLIGSTLCILLAFLSVSEQAIGGILSLTQNGFCTGALFLLFLLILAGNMLKRIGLVREGLRPRELMAVFSMLLMASAVSTKGVVSNLLPHLAGFVFYATPENGWESVVVPLLPDGLVIKDHGAAKGFFEGLGSEGRIPFRAWIGPLFAWGVFLASFYVTLMSLMVILRKRWMEEERLSYPMAQLPFSLVEGDAGEPKLLRNGIFWSGFVVPASIGLCQIGHRFVPFIPAFNLYYVARFYRNSIHVPLSANFLVLGISYLVSLEILGSIILFVLIYFVQAYFIVTSASPILGNPGGPYSEYTHLHQEGVGAVIVLVGFGIYEARHHLKDVYRKAFRSAPDVNDQDEMFSYRTAVIGMIGGTMFITFWLLELGITWWVIPIFLVMVMTMFLGMTRILSESGVVMQAPLSPVQVLLHSVGTQTLGGTTTAGFFLSQPWSFPTRDGPHVPASASTALKLTSGREPKPRALFLLSTLGMFLGGSTAALAMLYFVYQLGAFGFSSTSFVITELNFHLNYYGPAIAGPSEGQPVRLLWSGIGAVVMGLLFFARKRFFWWPVHPIGYPISSIPQWWFSVFMAWTVKRNVLKYGGPSLYGRIRPFFMGIVVGEAVINNVGSILAILTGRI